MEKDWDICASSLEMTAYCQTQRTHKDVLPFNQSEVTGDKKDTQIDSHLGIIMTFATQTSAIKMGKTE